MLTKIGSKYLQIVINPVATGMCFAVQENIVELDLINS